MTAGEQSGPEARSAGITAQTQAGAGAGRSVSEGALLSLQ
jgi:hypothetical protein